MKYGYISGDNNKNRVCNNTRGQVHVVRNPLHAHGHGLLANKLLITYPLLVHVPSCEI